MLKYLLFLLVLTVNEVYSQTASNPCIPSGNTEVIYSKDAYRLAIKRVNDINSRWKDSVEVSQIFVDLIAKALYAIENMEWSPLKDTIKTLFGYSNFSTNYNNYSNTANDSIILLLLRA